jgi:hypothetical protein
MQKFNQILIGAWACIVSLASLSFACAADASDLNRAPGSLSTYMNVKTEFMKDEQIYGSKTFCVSIVAAPKRRSVPTLQLDVHFPDKTSGFLEFDGKRVLYWKNATTPKWSQSLTKEGFHRITIGVDSPIRVDEVRVYGPPPITKVADVACK